MDHDPHMISDQASLRAMYGESAVEAKKVPELTPSTVAALDLAPFFVLSTADANGRCDASPRGGPPGLIQILDDSTVAFPDLPGNRLIDSLQNIVDNPHLGMLVITPGKDDTIRIDGRAHLTTDPEILARWDGVVRKAKLAVVVSIDAVFVHCALAFRRSELWDPRTWPDYESTPDLIELFSEMTGLDMDVNDSRASLEDGYTQTLAEERAEQ